MKLNNILKKANKYIPNLRNIFKLNQKSYFSEDSQNNNIFVRKNIKENNVELELEKIKKYHYVSILESDKFKNNKELLNKIIKRIENDREVLLEIVKHNGFFLEYLSHEFKNDIEIVSHAVKNTSFSFEYASHELQNDKDFVIKLVKETGNIFLLKNIDGGFFTGKELNDMLPDLKLRKKIKDDMETSGYKIGINENNLSYSEGGTDGKRGLYFTNVEFINYIDYFEPFEYDLKTYEIKLPNDSHIFIKDYTRGKSNKIEIIGEVKEI